MSYLMLRSLVSMLSFFPKNVKRPFKYVMTDFAEDTVNFWRSYEPFQDFIRDGWLDFAVVGKCNSLPHNNC